MHNAPRPFSTHMASTCLIWAVTHHGLDPCRIHQMVCSCAAAAAQSCFLAPACGDAFRFRPWMDVSRGTRGTRADTVTTVSIARENNEFLRTTSS